MKRLQLVVVCIAAFGLPAAADDLRTVPFSRFGIASDTIGYGNMILADLTGDTRPEIISCSAGAPVALGFSAGSYGPVWHGPEGDCSAVAVGDTDGDGAMDIITVDGQWAGAYPKKGSIKIFDPRGLGNARMKVSMPQSGASNDVAFGNVDFDAAPEIVVLTDYATYVYDAVTLELQWTADGYGGNQLALGDVDGDARPEIIINKGGFNTYQPFGAVLDGGLETVKWGYAGGFGPRLLVGNVDADTKQEIVFREGSGYQYGDIVILNGDFSSSRFTYEAWPVGIGDANGDGANEILADYDGVRGLRPTDGALLWTVPPPESGIFGEVAVGDVDGDASPEIVYGSGTSSYRDILVVASAVSQTVEHQSLDLDGELHSATGDVDGDGRAELVIASTFSNSNYTSGLVEIVDPRTRAIKGVLSNSTAVYRFEIERIAIGQLDDDPAREIVVLGDEGSRPTLVVWDGVTQQLQWKSPVPAWDAPMFVTTTMAVANIDGDARDEIIVGMTDGNLIALHGASPFIQASTPLNGSLVALDVADVDDDGVLEVAAGTTTKLYLLDTANWSVTNETPLSEIRDVAASGAGGGRIAVTFTSSTMHLRLFDLQLASVWTCMLSNTLSGYFEPFPVAFAEAGSEMRLLTGNGIGGLNVFPIASAPSCPAWTSIDYSLKPINDIQSADATGDGWPELMLDSWNAVEAHLIGLASELRGDADGDGSIGAADLDELTDNLFGATPGLLPMADVNADQRISGEDLFALIHYEYGGGPEPQP